MNDANLDEWAECLLDTLLPLRTQRHAPAALACDDEALRAAAIAAALPVEHAFDSLVRAVRSGLRVDASTGLSDLFVLKAQFDRAPRPRPTPRFLAPLCTCVLAASRMGPEDGHATQAYYPRLRSLLHLPPGGQIPGMECVPLLMQALAEWLHDDLDGARGRLWLPERGTHWMVDACVSQTIFRQRDRQVLSEFFASRATSLSNGLDPILLLRRWPGRHRLTAHALEMVSKPRFEEQVRACIHTAWSVWDGSVFQGTSGGRCWYAILHLVPPPRLRLTASSPSPEPIQVRAGTVVKTLEPGRQVELPLWVLADAAKGEVTLGDPAQPGGALRIPHLGETIVFEATDHGYVHTTSAQQPTVWVFTRDTDLQSRFHSHQARVMAPVPAGWVVLREVDVRALPGVRQVIGTETVAQIRIEAGLRLERSVYLTDEGPELVLAHGEADDPHPLQVDVNGTRFGFVLPGERIALPASVTGTYQVSVDHGLFNAQYHVDEYGAGRGAYGSLSYDMLRRPLRSGATGQRSSRFRVCGATVSFPRSGPLPLLRRAVRTVLLLSQQGGCSRLERPPDIEWLRDVGLPAAARWEVPTDDVAWVIDEKACEAWCIGQVEATQLTPEAATLLQRLGPEVQARDRTGRRLAPEAWASLMGLVAAGRDESV